MKKTLTLIAGALLACASHAGSSVLLYDDFSSGAISPSLWVEGETQRLVDSKGRLAMTRYIFGGSGSTTGTLVDNLNLNLTDTAPAKSLKASITVTDISTLQGCAANATPSSSRARLIGSFFNVRSGGPVAGDQTGDVLAQAYLRRYSNSTDAAGVLLVYGTIVQCSNFDCSSSTTLASGSLGTTTVGTAETLKIDWDKKNNQFKFTRGSNAPVLVSYSSLDDSKAPSKPFNHVSIRTEAANCGPDERVKAGMSAWFDKIGIAH